MCSKYPKIAQNLVVGILVGGANRRMGRPKALIQIDGATLLERTVQIARCVTDDVLLLGIPPFDLPNALTPLPVLADRHPGIGPIGGLQTLLNARPENDCILLACDMPFLNERLLQKLITARGDCDAAVCSTRPAVDASRQWHPCCGLYSPSAQSAVRETIEAGQLSLMRLLDRLRVVPIELLGDEVRWVENWNRPEDVATATARDIEGRPC